MRKLLAAAAIALIAARSGAAPITRQELSELVAKGVSEELVRKLVACACVDVPIDEPSLADLRREVPEAVVVAVIACRAAETTRVVRTEAPPVGDATAFAAPAPPPVARAQVGIVAVAPVAVDGEADPDLTAYLIDQLGARRAGWTLLAAPPLAPAADEPGAGAEGTLAPAARDAARALGAQALLVARASSGTNAMGSTEVTIELRLVPVDGGAPLWSASGSSAGGGLTGRHAARLAVRAALKKLTE